MLKRTLSICWIAALFSLSLAAAQADGWRNTESNSVQSGADQSKTEAISESCATYGTLVGDVFGPGSTSGQFGTFTADDSVVFTATGNGTGSWRIVADPDGNQTLASGGTFPGTLTYQVPEGVTVTGMGFYVDSYSGNGDTITGICQEGDANPVPALATWNQLLLALLLGFIGFAIIRRKRVS